MGEGNGTPLQYCCLENPMDGGAWWAAVHGVTKSQTQLSDFAFTFHFHALEKEMATHSSVLAWRIPWTEKPGRLQSMGSHRVGHDWSDLAAAAAWTLWTLALARFLCLWNFPGKNTGVGCHSLLHLIFPTQGSNLRLLHWQADSLPLCHFGSLSQLVQAACVSSACGPVVIFSSFVKLATFHFFFFLQLMVWGFLPSAIFITDLLKAFLGGQI